MKVTIFNKNPRGVIVAPEAFKKAIGQKVPIRNTNTGEVGEGTLLDVRTFEDGIEVTYETDMNLGISINFPMSVEKLTARMKYPVLARLVEENGFAFCVTLRHILDTYDEQVEQINDLKRDVIRLAGELNDEIERNQRQWDEHSCTENCLSEH